MFISKNVLSMGGDEATFKDYVCMYVCFGGWVVVVGLSISLSLSCPALHGPMEDRKIPSLCCGPPIRWVADG
jgi:hypothetical protein